MSNLLRIAACSLILIALAMPSSAREYKIGNIVIDHPVARATPPGAKVAGGYLVIKNKGKQEDRLVGGSAPFASNVEVHEMKMGGDNNSVMTMKELEDGLPLTPGSTVKLAPGGYHLMFTGLKERLSPGEERPVTLTFEKAGTVEVEFEIKTIAETMKMKHSH